MSYLCDRCGRSIAVTVRDPLIWTKLGRMHDACAKAAWFEKSHPRPAARVPSVAASAPSRGGVPSIFGPLLPEIP